ncbi:hypothetical protein AZ18_1232 [Bordetella bronchiseptica D993]|uniref:hypothetical protein n=1 Tax=Bordetella bronchiseptica TaxID=518 RepID=UPI00046136B6|nr:hypothetical protein AZ18_1232 [Bordetella bronchiseptica D993]
MPSRSSGERCGSRRHDGSAAPVSTDLLGRASRSEKELVDLTVAIGLMNAYNRMAIGFRNTPKAAV